MTSKAQTRNSNNVNTQTTTSVDHLTQNKLVLRKKKTRRVSRINCAIVSPHSCTWILQSNALLLTYFTTQKTGATSICLLHICHLLFKFNLQFVATPTPTPKLGGSAVQRTHLYAIKPNHRRSPLQLPGIASNHILQQLG